MAKRVSYIDMDLNWLESKANELKEYCDSKNIKTLKDRLVGKKVTATVEVQIKCIRETLKDCISIFEAIDKLREKDNMKVRMTSRGDRDLSPLETGEI